MVTVTEHYISISLKDLTFEEGTADLSLMKGKKYVCYKKEKNEGWTS